MEVLYYIIAFLQRGGALESGLDIKERLGCEGRSLCLLMTARRFVWLLGAALAILGADVAPAADGDRPKVVVSIKPVHSLVAAVMEGLGAPLLLVKGAGSPHGFSLRPSQARALAEADVVFRVGPEMESFLDRPLRALAGQARVVDLTKDAGLLVLPRRAGGSWETHVPEEREAQNGPVGALDPAWDPHVWLDPRNAQRIVAAATRVLSEADPGNAEAYAANGAQARARLAQLDAALESRLAPLRGVPYVVFHDAYQYLEQRYALTPLGAVTVSPERPPGARRLSDIRARIAALGARCVFGEPQFEPALARTLLDGTPARFAELDPLGAAIPAGPGAYPALMEALADALVACLADSG